MPTKEGKPRNIVVCCDGTGNEFGDNNSNVVKLYTMLKEDDEQWVYYHPGVGTMGAPNRASWFGRTLSRIGGLAFGSGFMDNLGDAYRYLMDNYGESIIDGKVVRDRIFLLGFSRGAYTARALAGAINLYGLLCPGNEGHIPYLLRLFSETSHKDFDANNKQITRSDLSRAFKETFSRAVAIHFVGVWDTVSSVGWISDPVKLLYDGQNSIIRTGRHAVSVDERRAFFQDNLWGLPLPPGQTPLLKPYLDEEGYAQDIVQAWFPGVHSDVGGSYKQSQSAPALDALQWMVEESTTAGLILDESKRKAIFGLPQEDWPNLGKLYTPPPADMHSLHESLCRFWWILELFPHVYFDEAGKKQTQFAPWAHRREIPDRALLHPALLKRLAQDPNYHPPNLDPARIHPAAEYPDPNLRPEVNAELATQSFGVYRLPAAIGARTTLPTHLASAAALLLGVGIGLARLRK